MDSVDAKKTLEDAIDLVGDSLDMCPEFERHEREFERTLDRFEVVNRKENRISLPFPPFQIPSSSLPPP